MRRLLVCAALVGVISTLGSLEAKTVRCPQKNPLFKINIPDSWTTTWEKDGSLTCMPSNHSKYVSVIPSENVNSREELRTQLSKTAQAAAQNAKMKDQKVGPISEATRSNGLSLMSITASGTSAGKPMTFTLVAFAPKKDNYFTVIGLEPASVKDKQIGAIINSISSAR